MDKRIMSGNEALARGAFEGGVRVASAYPGTPSTEILEYIAESYKSHIYCEWAPNEKVAAEVVSGSSMAGARSICAQKHVGLNVAADPLFSIAYIGAKGSLVFIVADDPGCHSSQNEQDCRHFGRAAKIPVIEPSDSQECKDFMIEALDLSEKLDTPVLLRTTTRVAHSTGIVTLGERVEHPVKGYERNIRRNVVIPAHARLMHIEVEKRLKTLAEMGATSPLNRIEEGPDKSVGFITSGISYQYIKELLPNACILKLGLTWPLPEKLVRDFAARVGRVIVVEENEPFLENEIKALGIACEGRKYFPAVNEFNANIVAKGLKEAGVFKADFPTPRAISVKAKIPGRPPTLCPGCPHRGVFYTLRKLDVNVTGDIGCYTLGMMPPLSALHTCQNMGASISHAYGLEKAVGPEISKKTVAVIGDSTFLHSGITGLMNAVYNKSNITVMILDNRITAMTGHQQNPGTGHTLMGETATEVDLVALCKSIGVQNIATVDPLDAKAMLAALQSALATEGVSVLITKAPCALIIREKRDVYEVDPDVCVACGTCLKVGCVAISKTGEPHPKTRRLRSKIDPVLCVGCGFCAQVCPVSAIRKAPKEVK
ncbi:MAG: indolepyruvate ferredoxin oxidoreductase subunit alpha [Candidatus Brocadiia bacterium]